MSLTLEVLKPSFLLLSRQGYYCPYAATTYYSCTAGYYCPYAVGTYISCPSGKYSAISKLHFFLIIAMSPGAFLGDSFRPPSFRSVGLLCVPKRPLRAFVSPSVVPLHVPWWILLPRRRNGQHSLPFWTLLPFGVQHGSLRQCWHSMRCSGMGHPLMMPRYLLGVC